MKQKKKEQVALYARIDSELIKRVDRAREYEMMTWKALLTSLLEDYLSRSEFHRRQGDRGLFRK